MKNTILILQESHIKWGAKKFDEKYDFSEILKNRMAGAILEAVDGKGAEITLDFANKRISEFVPDEYKDELHVALDDVIDGDGDYENAVANVILIADDLKNKMDVSPLISALLSSLLELIKAAVLIFLEQKNKV